MRALPKIVCSLARLLVHHRPPFFTVLASIGDKLQSTLLPSRCLICQYSTTYTRLCSHCDAQYFSIQKHRCIRCALPLAYSSDLRDLDSVPGRIEEGGGVFSPLSAADISPMRTICGSVCGACLAHPPAFDDTLTLADYGCALGTLAAGLKFHARFAIAHEWAMRLAHTVRTTWPATAWPDCIVPVPLSAQRLSVRGYNQAWEIARPLARALKVPAQASLLKRIRDTPPQMHLSRNARQSNLRQAFALTFLNRSLAGQHIAVVDDVMTSGATLAALASILKEAGAVRVSNLVALRTPKEGISESV